MNPLLFFFCFQIITTNVKRVPWVGFLSRLPSLYDYVKIEINVTGYVKIRHEGDK